MYPGGGCPHPRDCAFSGGYLLKQMLSTSKHRRPDTTALVRNIPETFKKVGMFQQFAFSPQKAMLAGMMQLINRARVATCYLVISTITSLDTICNSSPENI